MVVFEMNNNKLHKNITIIKQNYLLIGKRAFGNATESNGT